MLIALHSVDALLRVTNPGAQSPGHQSFSVPLPLRVIVPSIPYQSAARLILA